MLTKLKGHDGTDWQNLPMVFGYSDRLCERATAECDDTTFDLDSIVVPANKIWVVLGLTFMNEDGACKCEVGVYDGVNTTYFSYINLNTTNLYYIQYASPKAILKAGDKIRWHCTSVANGEIVHGHAVGYIMNLA